MRLWLARVCCLVLLVLVFGSPAHANLFQRHVLDASINLGWVTETLAREGRTAANQADVALGMDLAEAHVRAVVDLLRAPYQDLDFSGVLAALSRWDGATAGMSAAQAAAHVQQIQRHLREVVAVYFDARTQRLVPDGNCDSHFADVGFHFGRAHIAGLRGLGDAMTGHLGNMRQAIRGGLQQDQLKLCGFGVPVDWDGVPVLRGDTSADGFWWSLVLIQAIALQAGRGGGTVGAVPVPLSPPVGPPPAPTPPLPPTPIVPDPAPPGSIRHSVVVLFDASGSMRDHDRIGMAKRAAREVLTQLTPDTEVALIVFYDCHDIRVERSFTTDVESVLTQVDAIQPSGGTPLAAGITTARAYIADHARGAPRLVVLSDGMETCGGDPVEAARQ